MSDNTRNNTTLVWGCIGRSCALCKKDHKACNGARPCSRCIGMGWESECRDVALKPRGRPRKTRSKAKGPAATTSSKGSSINADEDDQPLSVSPSLFVTSFPFLSTTGPKGDISEKVSKLTQRLGGSHVPAVSSGLRSDAASPKVNRKRRAVGPSSACEAAAFSSNKRREIVEEEEEVDEEEVIEEVDRDELKNNNNHNNHNTHNNDDEVDDFAVDEDEPDVEEGLIPYEMVFRVNLVSSCSTSSKKQTDNNNNNTHNNTHNNNNKKATSSTTKKKTSSCSHNNTHNTRNKSPAKEAGFERKVLKQIEEEVDMGLFRLDFANASAADVSDNTHNNNNTHTFGSVASASVAMDTATPHQACLGSEEEMIDSFSCAEQYVQEYWQQHNHHNNHNHNHNNHNNTCGMLDSTYILQQQQQQTQQQQQQQPQQHNFSFFMDSMGITSTANASFMFLKTEPMALAQEEKLGRNPYFIRTPPQLRRCVQGSNPTVQTASLVDCMEDEDAWF